MKSISIVIPAYNEQGSIARLLDSLAGLRYPREAFEVLVVNDGSSDDTAGVVRGYAAKWAGSALRDGLASRNGPDVRLVDLPENVGRFACRRRGAEAARYPNILFVDAHSTVDPHILAVLDGLPARAVNGRVQPVASPGPFETFYRSIRRLLFPGFYRENAQPFYLTADNFDAHPKGTTVLYVEKELLEAAYRDLAAEKMDRDSSDDTKLLRAIVAHQPILNHPGVRITYFPRTSFRASLRHLYERGPKFVDYYLHPAQRNFWLVIVLPLLAALLGGLALCLFPAALWLKLAALAGLDLALTLVLARSAREVGVIALMLPLCALTFYAGILKGLWLKLKRTNR